MARNNKIIPNEELSSREKIERKIKRFEGRPFTLDDINKSFRPKMRHEAIRFHVENLVNNLYIEKLPREGREKQLYVYRDLLKDLEADTNLNGDAHAILAELYNMAFHLRQGHVLPEKDLLLLREHARVLAAELQEQVNDLLKLHDCTDLWQFTTLVNRLGFLNAKEDD